MSLTQKKILDLYIYIYVTKSNWRSEKIEILWNPEVSYYRGGNIFQTQLSREWRYHAVERTRQSTNGPPQDSQGHSVRCQWSRNSWDNRVWKMVAPRQVVISISPGYTVRTKYYDRTSIQHADILLVTRVQDGAYLRFAWHPQFILAPGATFPLRSVRRIGV